MLFIGREIKMPRRIVLLLTLFFVGLTAGAAFVIWLDFNPSGIAPSFYIQNIQDAIQAGLLVFLISAFIALLTLSKYDLKSLKPTSAVSRLASASHPISNESHVKGSGKG